MAAWCGACRKSAFDECKTTPSSTTRTPYDPLLLVCALVHSREGRQGRGNRNDGNITKKMDMSDQAPPRREVLSAGD